MNWLPWQQWMTYRQSFNFKNFYTWLPKHDISLVKISWTVFEIFSQTLENVLFFQLSHFNDVIKSTWRWRHQNFLSICKDFNQSTSKHGLRTFLYDTMRELVCNGQLWARAAVRQLRSHNVRQQEYLAATVWRKPRKWLQYILTSTQSFVSRDYCNKSLMTILGLAGVLFCKISRHGQNGLSFVPKKMLTWVPGEARGGLKSIAGKRQHPYNHFIHTTFLLLSVYFCQTVVFPARLCSTPFQHIDIVGLSQAELWRTY